MRVPGHSESGLKSRSIRRFRYAERIRGSWLRTATVQLIGEGARPAPWDLPLKLGRMGFSGWSPEAVEFFQDLQADNTKAYWSAHKDWVSPRSVDTSP